MAEHGRPGFDEQRMLAKLQVMKRDLTRLKAELDRSERLATLGTLAGMIAHEFNNIMTPVRCYAQLALRRPDDPETTRKALEEAVAGANQATRIAESILALAAGSSREPKPPAATCDVQRVVERAIACLAGRPGRDRVCLETDIEPGCRAGIDEVDLQHVLVNLMANACRAMPASGGRLTLGARTQRLDEISMQSPPPACSTWNTNALVLEVTDTGCGIPEELLPTLFEPYTSHPTLEDADKTDTDGPRSGLGLALCRRLVEHAGGGIAVRSTVGEGTTFKITLPVGSAAPTTPAAPSTGC